MYKLIEILIKILINVLIYCDKNIDLYVLYLLIYCITGLV